MKTCYSGRNKISYSFCLESTDIHSAHQQIDCILATVLHVIGGWLEKTYQKWLLIEGIKKWLRNPTSFQFKHFNLMLMYLLEDIKVPSIYFAHNYSLSLLLSVGWNLTVGTEERSLHKFMRSFWREVKEWGYWITKGKELHFRTELTPTSSKPL